MRSLRPVTDTPPRAVLYLRQSIAKDDSISIEMQETACRDYCERMGYTVVAVRADPGVSGRSWSKRPDVQSAMDAIEHGDADVIVLWKWSRLSRSRKDWALAIDRVDVAGGRIESATEPIDTATASGRFARGVMTEYAAFQSEQIGEVWEEVRQRRLRMGLPASGRLPYGWQWADGGIQPDPDQAPVVVEMFLRYLSGEGSAQIAHWLNTEKVPGPNGNVWTRVRPFTVMDSPIHAGFIPYRGKVYDGAHAPIIDRDVWDAYRAERASRRQAGTRPRRYDYLLSTLVRCSCGSRMYGKGSITAGQLYVGYLCERRSTTVEHTGRAYVSGLTLHPPVEEWAMRLRPDIDTAERPTSGARARRQRLLREAGELEKELTFLARQHARDIIPEGAYLAARAEIEHELTPMMREAERLAAEDRAAPAAAAVYDMQTAWPEMVTSAKNAALRRLVAAIDLHEDGRGAVLRTTWGTSSVLHF